MYYQAGRVSTCGSMIRAQWTADRTATVLDRLHAAGSITFAGLNMAEFAQNPTGHNRHHGDCHNPWNLPYVTGGSSSGSGAAVAARFTYGALGSDTGGLHPPPRLGLRRHRPETHPDPRQPRRRHAAQLLPRQRGPPHPKPPATAPA